MDKAIEKIRADFLKPAAPGNFGKTSLYWVIALAILMCWGVVAYIYQLRNGLEATAMRNYVSWGLYISTFVFFIGISHSGTLVSAILRVTNQEWRRPITRSAELLTAVALMFGGIMPIIDMGRPDRVANMVIFGRVQSPLLWDIMCITTYLTGSLLFLYLPMIPDIALAKERFASTGSKLRLWVYDKLAMGWEGTPDNWRRLEKAMRIMTVMIIPIAVSVHTVVSYIFAMTLRAGWNSTIFGPYFVIGALYSGSAGVILTMAAFRKIYHLEEYITPRHFDLMGKIVLSLTMIYAYFNLNEYWVPAYKMESHEGFLLSDLFSGGYSTVFWVLQFGTVLLPIVMLALPRGRKPLSATIACIIIVVGAWIKRYVIVIPTLLHPFLPIQNVPQSWATYFPNWVEWSVTIGALSGIFLVITLFSKFFPIGSIWEVEEGVRHAHGLPSLDGHTNGQLHINNVPHGKEGIRSRKLPFRLFARVIVLCFVLPFAAHGQSCPMDPPKAAVASDSSANSSMATLQLAVRDADSAWIVRASLTGKDSLGHLGPLANATVSLKVQRLFGLMPVGDESTATTDDSGAAEIAMPKDIPGDVKGALTLVARVEDNDRIGPIEARLAGNWGQQVHTVADPFPRALWEPRAPVAMIITFMILFGGVWTTYGIIVSQLVTIKKGKHNEV